MEFYCAERPLLLLYFMASQQQRYKVSAGSPSNLHLSPRHNCLLQQWSNAVFHAGIVLCFGGGVLLSTVFIHMVVEVRESLERATNMGMIPRHMEFPFAELLICMGNNK